MISIKELKEQIKDKKFRRLYLFYGCEDYLKNLYAQRITDALLPKNACLMNLDTIDGKTYSLDALAAKCETMPFMADVRIIVVKESGIFAPSKRAGQEKAENSGNKEHMAERAATDEENGEKSASKEHVQTADEAASYAPSKKTEASKTEKYLSDIPDTAIVIFIEEKVDKRLTIFKAALKNGICAEFDTPDESALIQWIISEAKSKNRNISRADAAFLLHTAPPGMGSYLTELDKLADYTQDTITKQDIAALTTKSVEYSIFQLVDAIGNKNLKNAVDIYNNLLFLKMSPFMVLVMAARQFKLILACAKLHANNKNTAEIAKLLDIKDFTVRSYLKQSGNFTADTLERAYRECLETDVNIKTGKIAERLGVEMLIIKYAGV